MKIRIFAVVLPAFFLWSCTSSPKPAPAPQKPESQSPLQSDPAQTAKPQETKVTEVKTIIPPDETKATDQETALREKNAGLERDEAAVLLEEAFNAYQEAKLARERGDLDAALKALDGAYGIILKLQIPPDSPLSREKNDLRLLIAQRIQEIYASSRNPISGNHNAIPLVENKWVSDEVKLFSGVERKSFEEAYRRSGLYKDWIQGELRKSGLPEELSWLPVVESWFQVRALSRARALGLWQFIPSTGYRYGLTRDKYIDERMDPYKATQAAIKYLVELHSFFGEWTTALASYNCGEGVVQRVINTQNINYLDNFWDVFQRLPFETARFVPRFIAAVLIIQNPEKYGMALPTPYGPLKFDTVKINRPMKLTALSKELGLEGSELTYLNPELRQDSTPDREYDLKIPVGYSDRILQVINSVPKYVPPEYDNYIVRSGDTLSHIAAKYGTSVRAIIQLNGLKSNYLIRPGQKLQIPKRS